MPTRPTVVNVITKPSGGGAEFLVRQLHLYLQKHGFQSILIFLDADGHALQDNELALPYGIRSLANILALRRLFRRLKAKNKTLVVHAHLTWGQLFCALASLGLGIVLICTEHSTSNRRRRLPMFCYIERLFYSAFREIICISSGVRRSMEQWLGSHAANRLITIHNGARAFPLACRPPLAGRKANLVSIGSLTPRKNFATTVKAVAQVRDCIEQYVIVGHGQEHNALASLIAKHRLSDVVKLVGWQDDPSPWLRSADIQLVPSLWEGFGLVAVEGMSTGLPIIASDVDGLREVVSAQQLNCLLVHAPFDVNTWAEMITTMIGRVAADERNEIATLGNAKASGFSLDAMCHSYTKAYERVAA